MARRLILVRRAAALRFYKNGWQSWSPTLVLDCAGEDVDATPPVIAPGTRPAAVDGRFVSDMMTAIVEPQSNNGVVAGFVSNADQFSHLWFERGGGTLTAASYADGIEVAHRQTLASERLYIDTTDAPLDALCRYGDELALQMEALPHDAVTSGWCSWYHYFTKVSEADVLENLEFLAARKDDAAGGVRADRRRVPGGDRRLADRRTRSSRTA